MNLDDFMDNGHTYDCYHISSYYPTYQCKCKEQYESLTKKFYSENMLINRKLSLRKMAVSIKMQPTNGV